LFLAPLTPTLFLIQTSFFWLAFGQGPIGPFEWDGTHPFCFLLYISFSRVLKDIAEWGFSIEKSPLWIRQGRDKFVDNTQKRTQQQESN